MWMEGTEGGVGSVSAIQGHSREPNPYTSTESALRAFGYETQHGCCLGTARDVFLRRQERQEPTAPRSSIP